jgi:hypothetical protein
MIFRFTPDSKKNNNKKLFCQNLKNISDNLEKSPQIRKEFSKTPKEFCNMAQSFINERNLFYCNKQIAKEVTQTLLKAISRSVSLIGSPSGLVFAGFGREERFPYLESFSVDGAFIGQTRYWSYGDKQKYNPNSIQPFGYIGAFAQGDMVQAFMDGTNPELPKALFEGFEEILDERSEEHAKALYPNNTDQQTVEYIIQCKSNEASMESLKESYKDFVQNKFVSPLMEVVSSLPRDEMAMMAEALVDITSLRRKVDSSIESVAGPVDVAFISKGDGLVWIKRKHYFNGEINSDFHARREMRYTHRKGGKP